MSQEEAMSQLLHVATNWVLENMSEEFPVLEIMDIEMGTLHLQIQTQIWEHHFAPNILSSKSQLVWETTSQISSCQQINVPTAIYDFNVATEEWQCAILWFQLAPWIYPGHEAEWLPVSDRSFPSSCLGMVKESSFAICLLMFSLLKR